MFSESRLSRGDAKLPLLLHSALATWTGQGKPGTLVDELREELSCVSDCREDLVFCSLREA